MGKSCCAVECTNRYLKASGILSTASLLTQHQRIAADHKNWIPTEHSQVCSVHFIFGCKNNDCVSPDYVPSIFKYVESPKKRKLVKDMERYENGVH